MNKKELIVRKLIREEVKRILTEVYHAKTSKNEYISDYVWYDDRDGGWLEKFEEAYVEYAMGTSAKDRIDREDYLDEFVDNNYKNIVRDIMKDPDRKEEFMQLK